MDRNAAGIKAFEMLAEAQQDGSNEQDKAAGVLGISTYDTVTLVRMEGDRYDVADNGDAAADLNEHEVIDVLRDYLMDHN